ncbi:serine/threonine-protein kinase [Paracoccus aminophilus]|uniref:Serine/threonine protein kinase n=1 Tax=Paracoccus aminophilus JCM 7686 TaxID=1367847 RepID=S5XVC7_PARAH|nr:serine/threonine-protein kinase [Paracoccus aminophilus]AGT11469.1 serine/threonine protein kinase [Paracoccus aminophilus JCM 7686]
MSQPEDDPKTGTSPPAAQPPSPDPSHDDRTRIALPAATDAAEPTRIASAGPATPTPDAEADRTRFAAHPPELPPESPAQIVKPGTVINDNYRILETISAGGMGEVYRGENLFTGDPVAVKVILPNLARDQAIIDLFRGEARILVQMRDDAIVRYHNFVRDRGLDRYCLIMEYVEGQHLWDFVKSRGPLSAAEALILLRRLGHGLAEAHARGITHRDLSPDNVILRDDQLDQAVLIDFGIARSTELGDGLGGRFAGKFKYIAPEQLGHARGVIGPQADVYGLALMITAAVRGTALDMGSSVVEASETRRRIPDLTGIPHEIYPLLQHMLEPDPAARPESMEAILRILDDPTHLPARYRLPLWESGEAGAVAPAETTGTSGLLTGSLGGELASASPFATIAAEQAGTAPAERKTSRGMLYSGLIVAALVAAGGGFYAMRGAAPSDLPPGPTGAGADSPTETIALPARDPASRDGFLAEQPLPACSYAARIVKGVDAGKIGTLADGPRDFTALQTAYSGKFSSNPALVEGLVSNAQCPAVEFLHMLSGREAAPPALSLDELVVTSGGEASGRIRDLAGRSLWLFLVSPKGGIYDLSKIVTAEADGSFTFTFGISLAPDETGPQPQLLLALASDKPLASVAAAPAGSTAARLLPFALDEIRAGGGKAAVDVARFEVAAVATADGPVNEPARAPQEDASAASVTEN